MSDIIEIMARSICRQGKLWKPDQDIWDEGQGKHVKGWTVYVDDAQAALNALQEAGYEVVPKEPSKP